MLLKNNLLYTSETTQSIESGAPLPLDHSLLLISLIKKR